KNSLTDSEPDIMRILADCLCNFLNRNISSRKGREFNIQFVFHSYHLLLLAIFLIVSYSNISCISISSACDSLYATCGEQLFPALMQDMVCLDTALLYASSLMVRFFFPIKICIFNALTLILSPPFFKNTNY